VYVMIFLYRCGQKINGAENIQVSFTSNYSKNNNINSIGMTITYTDPRFFRDPRIRVPRKIVGESRTALILDKLSIIEIR
jgi:hypothetical protein